MKKKILTFFACIVILCLSCLTLVGCVGTKYDFRNFFSEATDSSSNITYTRDNMFYDASVVSAKHLTGSIYELEIKNNSGANRYQLYDILNSRKVDLLPNDYGENASRVIKGNIDIIVRDSSSQNNSTYVYYLPDGQIIHISGEYIVPIVSRNFQKDGTFYIKFNDVVRTVSVGRIGYIISIDQTESQGFFQNGNVVNSDNIAGNNQLLERLQLGKGYSIDLCNSSKTIIVMKGDKIACTFDADLVQNALAMNNGRILYFDKQVVAEDSKDYDFLLNKEKIKYSLKSLNLKTGKTKKINENYVFNKEIKIGENGDVIVAMNKINKDKTLNTIVEYFIVNGKGIVANVDNSFATAEEVVTLNSKEFLVNTENGSYIADKYLKSKRNLSKVKIIDSFTKQKILVAKQTINGTTKYGAIDFEGHVLVSFDYDSYFKAGNGLCYAKGTDSDKEYTVYNINASFGTYKLYNKACNYNYIDDGIVILSNNTDKIVNALTNEVIIEKDNLTINNVTSHSVGRTAIKLYVVRYEQFGYTYFENIVCKNIPNN